MGDGSEVTGPRYWLHLRCDGSASTPDAEKSICYYSVHVLNLFSIVLNDSLCICSHICSHRGTFYVENLCHKMGNAIALEIHSHSSVTLGLSVAGIFKSNFKYYLNLERRNMKGGFLLVQMQRQFFDIVFKSCFFHSRCLHTFW